MDARGLTDLGRAFLQVLGDLTDADASGGPRPLFDLAHLNPIAASCWVTRFPEHLFPSYPRRS